MRIEGSVALVTGASSGIGREVARRLAAGGARVLAHGRDAAALAELDAVPLIADLAEPGAGTRLAEAALAAAGEVRAALAAAGEVRAALAAAGEARAAQATAGEARAAQVAVGEAKTAQVEAKAAEVVAGEAEVGRAGVGRAGGAAGRRSVDIVVANAGVGWAGRFEEMPPAAVERLIAVNLTAPIELTRALLPAFGDRPGCLIFVTSIAGRMGVAGEAVYSASKAGLDAFAESLRFELQGRPVRVGVMVPGVVDTAFFERRGRPYDRRSPRPVSAGRVAGRILGMIEHGGAETYTPGWLRLPVAVRGALPGVYRRLGARFGGGSG